MAGGHYSDGISEFLIISPVWQIAENSDESDFENFRSSLCRAKGFVAVAVAANTWNMCFPHPSFTCGACPVTALRQSQSQSQS